MTMATGTATTTAAVMVAVMVVRRVRSNDDESHPW